MELEKGAHVVYKIRYHLVPAVKYRKVLLEPEVEECIRETMKGINEGYNIIIDELGFDGDHIHIFCGANPQYGPSEVLKVIKSITAEHVFSQFPNLREEELWGGESWSDCKHIGTVGETHPLNAVESALLLFLTLMQPPCNQNRQFLSHKIL